MDFIIIFALGYCFRDFTSYLKNLVNYQQLTIDDWDTEFEEWSSDDLPYGNGFTQKEMLNLILEGQQDINKRIDQLHEKVNQKISRQELSGWLVAISALVVLINNLM